MAFKTDHTDLNLDRHAEYSVEFLTLIKFQFGARLNIYNEFTMLKCKLKTFLQLSKYYQSSP